MALTGNIFFLDWEISLMEWLQANLGAGAISFISLLSMFGEELLLVAIMGFFYWSWDKKIGKYIGLNMLVASVWNPMIKNVFLRLRPYFASDKIQLLRKIDADADIYDVAAQGYSFPSGHSASAASVYGSIARTMKRKLFTVLAFVLPLLVGFSRVVVGAHFPTDVLVGWALGALIIFLIPWLREKIKNRWLFYAVLLLSTLPGFFYCESSDYFTSFGMLIGFMCAEPFEEKFVKFENTRSVVRSILRVIGGAGLYFAVNTVLKMPFSSAFLDSGTVAAHLVRVLRYAVVIFVTVGVYPMLFKLTAKIGAKKAPEET
ncbi:MAG: phosphatase PAP2 family protein [Oscillospiraceae bacterium]|nr:phosphatase PAP2 family protein [Oscillospiraceae bacterium]